MRSRPLSAVLLSLFLSGAAWAAEPPVLELSLEQACIQALENSPDVAVERLADQGFFLSLRELEVGYEPYLSSTAQLGSKREPAQSIAAERPTLQTDSFDWGLTVDQPLKSGGALRLDLQSGRLDSTDPLSLWRPAYSTTLQLGLIQPLLRNFKVDERRHRIRVARKNRAISELAFREAVLNITAEAKARYYALLFAIDNLDVHSRVFEMVRRMQEDNRERVKAGILARFDLLLGDSELAARREALTVAEADLARAEDALKRLVLKPGDIEAWKAGVKPTDNPAVEPMPVDADAAVRVALADRTDLQAARLGLERGELVQQYARNQAKPGLDLALTYGTLGFGGTQVVPAGTDGTGQPANRRGYGGVLSDALGNHYPSWAVGLNFSYPILNRAAETAVARAQVGRDLAAAQVAVLEQSVIAEVRDAARSVEIGFARVRQAREALGFQKQRLDAEMERFAAGKSSAFFVIQAQRDMVITELTERDAVTDYRRSLVRYERAQAAGVSADGFLQ